MSEIFPQSQSSAKKQAANRPWLLWSWAVNWLKSLFELIRHSQAFQFAVLLYIVISALQAWHQQLSAPSTQVALLTFPNEDLALCAHYPNNLTRDGDTRQGLLSLRLMPASGDDQCSEQNRASQLSASSPITVAAALTLPNTFALYAGPDLLFLDDKGASYSPVITLTLGSEKSIAIAHARVHNNNTQGMFAIKHIESNAEIYAPHPITLESVGYALWWRKFAGILLAPTAGALLALAAIAFDEIRKRDERKFQDEREQRDKECENELERVQIFCEGTLKRLENEFGEGVVTTIQNWLARFEQIPLEVKRDPKSQQRLNEVWMALLAKFVEHVREELAQLNNFDSTESKIFVKLQDLAQIEADVLEDVPGRFRDLEYVITLLFSSAPVAAHMFADFTLFGCYANLAWLDDSNHDKIDQERMRLLEKSEDQEEFCQAVLKGMWITQNLMEHRLTVRSSRKPGEQTWLEYLKDGSTTTTFTEELSGEFLDWVKRRQIDRSRKEVLKQRSLTGLSFIRDLWPLDNPSSASSPPGDADYDFPGDYDDRDAKGTAPIYWLPTDDRAEGPSRNAFDICEQILSQFRHHIVAGGHQAGKTWLRLYLEWFMLISFPDSLPVFYFAPATLAYEANQWAIVRALASSIANQLIASLLERSNDRVADGDPLGNRRIALVPFLRQYGYHVPTGNRSLAQPVPPDRLVDIDLAYGKGYSGGLYTEMKQAIDQMPDAAPASSSASIEKLLDDVQHAVEIADYRKIFVLVDNWDDLPDLSRDRLLRELLDANLLAQLQNHNILLKVFVGMPEADTLSHLHEIGEIDRQQNDVRSNLVLYTFP